ncbi:MAG TPA: GNAT family N-acetyltransferase [Candidatus Avidehalobacter gallistercoris]|uniref:GNAT family N-acetyltransferase n=1 Tax=Candidatus Avidehalobacter gallistercoris TaxID=2840694 RepID=A0A9D1HKZ6_9FIRM|nr:GNAT family N-acetyltransferase [Candidatus Avidehalobacter gallistercoris]
MLLRAYQPSDCKILANLFYHTVHTVNTKDYSDEQINAWASGNIDLKIWNDSLLAHYTVIAEIDDIIAGFGDIDKTGYLDRLFVHPDYQRQGIATALCDKLEKSVNSPKITTHASITARVFFEKRGYTVVKEQQVQRHNVFLTNYVMELILS